LAVPLKARILSCHLVTKREKLSEEITDHIGLKN